MRNCAGLFDVKETAEEKALNRLSDMMIAKITSMQGKKSDWKKPWFTEGSMMPENLDGRQYNGMNLFFLILHTEEMGYKAPIYGTFDKFVSLNYTAKKERIKDKCGNNLPFVSVNKGEESFPVFLFRFTIINRETKKKITMDEYKTLSEEEKLDYDVCPRMQVHNVFNIDQTNLKEVFPNIYNKLVSKNVVDKSKKKDNVFRFDKADKMIKDNLWVCPINIKHQDSAYFSPKKDVIVVPEYNQFESGEAFYSTLFHEMAHSTGHKDRLNRLIESPTKEQYGQEELVAEMTAALVCHLNGFDNGVKEESVQYLKSWCDSIKKDAQFIKSVLKDVSKAYAMISNRMSEI